MSELIILLIAGAFSGFLGGLFGVGGGTIIVPALVFIYRNQGIDLETAGLYAVATSLSAMIILSGRSFLAHYRRKAGSIHSVMKMAVTGMLGSLLGSQLALVLGGTSLIYAFAFFEIIIGINLVTKAKQQKRPPKDLHFAKSLWPWLLVGFLSGLISSFFGVGGGIIAVPLQLFILGITPHHAVANSSGLIIINAIIGTIRYALAKPQPAALFNIGYIDISASILLAIIALFTAPIGVYYAHQLPAEKLKRLFGIFLCILALVLFLESYSVS